MRKHAPIVRVQLDFPIERVKELDHIMAKTGFTTRKELFDNALTLFEWAVGQRERGRTVASIGPKTGDYRELAMPALDSISCRGE